MRTMNATPLHVSRDGWTLHTDTGQWNMRSAAIKGSVMVQRKEERGVLVRSGQHVQEERVGMIGRCR